MKDEVEFVVDGIADRLACEVLRYKFLGCSTMAAIDLAADNLIREGKIAAQNNKDRSVKSPNSAKPKPRKRSKVA